MDRREYYLEILEAVRKRATCDRGMAGAILVRGNRLIATGYVGAPTGFSHCNDVGHEMASKEDELHAKMTTHCIRTVHAEANAILQCAREGISTRGAEMYCTMFPCYECAKMIINVGIIGVTSTSGYQDSEKSKQLFNNTRMKWECLGGEMDYGKPKSD